VFVSTGVCQPTQSQAGSSKKVTQTDTSVKLEQYFQKARKELKNNASEATIDSAKQVSKKIARGSGWVSTEISKSIEALEREIGKLSKDTKHHQP
jgi:hypothetical protein